MDYTIADDADWLSCSPAFGSSSGERDAVTVTYSTAGLAVGVHSGTITVSAPGAGGDPQSVTVGLTVHLLGDCGDDGTVSIGDVQKVIRMHLRLDPPGCNADCDGSGTISIGEVQKAIRAHLRLGATC
jgi:hypothetical protein